MTDEVVRDGPRRAGPRRRAMLSTGFLAAFAVVLVAIAVAFIPVPHGHGLAPTSIRIVLGVLPVLVVVAGVPVVIVVGRRRGWYRTVSPLQAMTRRERRALWASARQGESLNDRDTAMVLLYAASLSWMRWMAWLFAVAAAFFLVLLGFAAGRTQLVVLDVWMASLFTMDAVVFFRRAAQASRITRRYAGGSVEPIRQ